MPKQWLVVLVLPFAVPASNLLADQWPQFRGPNADGATTSKLLSAWDETTNVRWKKPLAGEGWSCPIVWNDRVFVTSADQVSGGVAPPASQDGPRRNDLIDRTYRWELVCLDAATGEERWRRTAHEGRPPLPRHSSNTYATETPVTDGERIYVYFGMVGLYCFDMNGEPLWSKDLGKYEMRAGWGTSSSPLLFKGKVYLQVDNEQQSFLVALDAKSGEEAWRTNRPEGSQYSSPIVWRNGLRTEIVAGGQKTRAYDPASGALLWELDMAKGRSSATPLAVGDRLYVGTELRNREGDDDSGGGFLFAVKPGGSGDITPASGAATSEYVAWRIAESGIQMASPVLCRGRLYLFDRRSGIVHCIDADSGATAYLERVPGARAFWASPWTDGERVYCLDETGTTFALAAGPELQVIAENRLDGLAWSTPAVADGAVYLRTAENLYCIAADGEK